MKIRKNILTSSKKADGLPWWMILMILALIFLGVMAFVGKNVFEKFLGGVPKTLPVD